MKNRFIRKILTNTFLATSLIYANSALASSIPSINADIGLLITDNPSQTLNNDVVASNHEYGIKIINSKVNFDGSVIANNNLGPGENASEGDVYGIKIINKSDVNFTKIVIARDNANYNIGHYNDGYYFTGVATNIFIDDKSNANFTDAVSTSSLNTSSDQYSEGVRVSNNSMGNFKDVSSDSHSQCIIIDQESKSIFDGNVLMNEERQDAPYLNNSSGLKIDNKSQGDFKGNVSFNGFHITGINVSGESTANFKGIVNAKNTLVSGNAIKIVDSKIFFDKQPILENNFNVFAINGQKTELSFNTDLILIDTQNIGFTLYDVQGLNFPSIDFISNPNLDQSTFLDTAKTEATFNGKIKTNSYSSIVPHDGSILHFKDTVTADNTSVNSFGIGLYSIQDNKITFDKAVSINNAYYSMVSFESDLICHDKVTITNNNGYGVLLSDAHFSQFDKAIYVDSLEPNGSNFGVALSFYTVDPSMMKTTFSGDIYVKNQHVGLFSTGNNATFNGNITIENSTTGFRARAPREDSGLFPVFNKSITLNNNETNMLANGGQATFNGPVLINGGNNGIKVITGNETENSSKFFFNDQVVINDVLNPIITSNTGVTNYLTFTKGLTVNNPNIAINDFEVNISNGDYITFEGDSRVDAQINGGIITISGAPSISKSIIAAQAVNFTSNDSSKRISLNADINGNEINTGACKFGIDNNLTFAGQLQTNNTTFDLGNKIVTIDGRMNHSDSDGTLVFNTVYNGQEAGHFVFANSESIIDFSNSSKIIFNIFETDNITMLKPGQERQFDMFEGNGIDNLQLQSQSNITINSPNNQFVVWRVDPQEGIFYQKLKDKGVEEMFKAIDSKGVLTQLQKNNDFVNEIYNAVLKAGVIKDGEIGDKMGNPDANAMPGALMQTDENVIPDFIDIRLANTIAAGDDENIYGVWLAPIIGKTIQKARNGLPGYRGSYHGGLFGFDSKIDEYLTLGISIGTSKGKLRHMDQNLGDRTNYNSYLSAIYLSYDLTDKWLMQNTFSFSISEVHNKEVRISAPVNKIAKSKYLERKIANNIGLGYKYMLNQDVLLIPFISFDFNRHGSINYTERGADIQNLKLSRKSMLQIDGILGARLYKSYSYNDYVVTPSLIANIRYALQQRKFKTDIRLAADEELKIMVNDIPQNRTIYRLGSSLNVSKDDYDCMFNYEFRKAKKYVNHQGSIKLQIGF